MTIPYSQFVMMALFPAPPNLGDVGKIKPALEYLGAAINEADLLPDECN